MTTIRITSPADFPKVVETILGFTPENSLVLMSVGGGPTARVDLDDTAAIIEGLAPAIPHWGNGIILLTYSDNMDDLDTVTDAFTTAYPNVPLLTTAHVMSSGVVIHDGQAYVPSNVNVGDLEARRIHTSREAMVDEVNALTDVSTALHMAGECYAVGDGARTWAYLNRYEALGGDTNDIEFRTLTHNLTNAIDPRKEN